MLGPVLFSLYINDLPTFLPASVKTSLYADDLAIWASSPSVECATSVVQAALNRLVEWSSKWRLPLNPLKCETSFFSLDPYQSHIKPSLHILNTPLKFNLTPNLHLTREPLILCPPNPPGLPHLVTPSHSTSHPHALAKTPLPSQHCSYHPPFHSISQRYLCLD